MPIKPLLFKGDKKPSKKRKHRALSPSTSADPSSATTAQDASTDDTTWLPPTLPSDLTGPCLLILPTNPPTCLASDIHGAIFASPLENLIDGRPETAEPHDVRQVWVANSIPGTQGISFKASHGRYLSCDGRGVLGAGREARGGEEGFGVELVEDGMAGGRLRWRVGTSALARPTRESAEGAEGGEKEGEQGKAGRGYLCATVEGASNNGEASRRGHNDDGDDDQPTRKQIKISLHGAAPASDPSTQLIIKMQARFKPQIQQEKETKAKEKVSRAELEHAVGRKLEDEEVKRLKRAKREGRFYEEVLDVRVKGKHDKFA